MFEKEPCLCTCTYFNIPVYMLLAIFHKDENGLPRIASYTASSTKDRRSAVNEFNFQGYLSLPMAI